MDERASRRAALGVPQPEEDRGGGISVRVLVVRAGLEAFVASLLGPPIAHRVSPRPLGVDVDGIRARIVGAGAVRARLEAR